MRQFYARGNDHFVCHLPVQTGERAEVGGRHLLPHHARLKTTWTAGAKQWPPQTITAFRIRPAAKKDRAALRRLFAFTGMFGADECDWKIMLDRKEGYEVLVAEEREKRSAAMPSTSPTGRAKSTSRTWLLMPRPEGAALAGVCSNNLIEQGRLRGSREIYLEVKSTNIPALRLYESTGFRKGFVAPGLLEGADLVAMYLPMGS
jgi:hypothetical protein